MTGEKTEDEKTEEKLLNAIQDNAELVMEAWQGTRTFLVFLEKRIARVNRRKMGALRKGDGKALKENITLQSALEEVYMMAIACLKKDVEG